MKTITTLLFLIAVNFNVISQVWVEQTPTTPPAALNSVSAVNTSVCWIVGINGTILYTSNAGTSWIYLQSGPMIAGNPIWAVAGISSTTALCAVTSLTSTYIFRTTNTGSSWTPIFIQNGGFLKDIKMVNALTGYAYGNPVNNRWTIIKTTNGGASFDSSSIVLYQTGNELAELGSMAVNGNNIWFGTNNFKIYRSINSGINWASSVCPSQNSIGLAFNGTTGFCGGDVICKTTNSGISWNIVSGLPGSGITNTFVFLSPSTFWYGRGNKIYYSTNNGTNFVQQYTCPSGGIYNQLSFAYSPTNNILSTIRGWGIANNGAISYYTESVGITKTSSEIPDNYKLYQNFPNPFNPSTTIKFDIKTSTFIELSVFDGTGREVKKLINSNLYPGTYEFAADFSELGSGIYFYRLSAPKFIETKKMLLIK